MPDGFYNHLAYFFVSFLRSTGHIVSNLPYGILQDIKEFLNKP